MGLTVNKFDAGDPLHPVYYQYPGQTGPQDAYIEIDMESGVIPARWDGEIGNAVPARVWHRLAMRFPVSPELTRNELNDLMDEIIPHAQVLIDAYECVWDGSNHVGRFDPPLEPGTTTDEARDAIRDLCNEAQPQSGGVWAAGEWLDGVTSRHDDHVDIEAAGDTIIIRADTTEEEIAKFAATIDAEAEGEQVTLWDTEEYLVGLRDDLEETETCPPA